MEAIKFMKMDFLKMKTQMKLVVLTVAAVLLFSVKWAHFGELCI